MILVCTESVDTEVQTQRVIYKVASRFSTMPGLAFLTPALFKGQLYFFEFLSGGSRDHTICTLIYHNLLRIILIQF